MMTIHDVLFFDCETTGIPDRKADWKTDFADYPHIVQFSWMHGLHMENHIIRPEGWDIPAETVEIHGITMERAMAEGEPFAYVVNLFIQDCHDAGLICAHNIHFDTSIIKANILRELGWAYYDANDVESALYKGKRIDTMTKSMKWVDARAQNGRLKFPNLSELYSRCFPGMTFPAHDAMEDVKAVARCLPVLVENGLVELKVKEYPEEVAAKATAEVAQAATSAAGAVREFDKLQEKPKNGSISHDNLENDKTLIPEAKSPQNENSAELTGIRGLLDENDF